MSYGENYNNVSRIYGDKSTYKTKIVKAFNIKPNSICELVLLEYCVSRIVKTIHTYIIINYVRIEIIAE